MTPARRCIPSSAQVSSLARVSHTEISQMREGENEDRTEERKCVQREIESLGIDLKFHEFHHNEKSTPLWGEKKNGPCLRAYKRYRKI